MKSDYQMADLIEYTRLFFHKVAYLRYYVPSEMF
jgi:hypothetical protein